MIVDIQPFQPDDLNDLVRIQNESAVMHLWSEIEIRRDLSQLEPDLRPHLLVARRDGRLIGVANAQRSAGSYHPQKFTVEIYVEPAHRSDGVGRTLYCALLETLKPMNPISLRVQVSESNPAALGFASRLGFVETKRDFVSLLDLGRFDFAPYGDWERHLNELGVSLATFRDLDSTQFRREWHQVFSIVRRDTPRADPISPIEFDFFEKNVVEDEELMRDATMFALKAGRIVGFSGSYRGARPGWVDQWLTAVVREERGKGVALALKLGVIRAVKAAGLSVIQTDNDTANAPILAINDRLGFVREPAVLSMLKEL